MMRFDGHATDGDFVGKTSMVTGQLTGASDVTGVRLGRGSGEDRAGVCCPAVMPRTAVWPGADKASGPAVRSKGPSPSARPAFQRNTRTRPSRETTTVRRLAPRLSGNDALESPRVNP
jgi:hypothetical protein